MQCFPIITVNSVLLFVVFLLLGTTQCLDLETNFDNNFIYNNNNNNNNNFNNNNNNNNNYEHVPDLAGIANYELPTDIGGLNQQTPLINPINPFFPNGIFGGQTFWPAYYDFNNFYRGSGDNVPKPPVIVGAPPSSSKPGIVRDREPLDVDFVSGTIGSPDDVSHHHGFDNRNPFNFPNREDSQLFQHTFGNFFNEFGGIFPGLHKAPRLLPWWRGSNVCVEREEDVEENDEDKKKKDAAGSAYVISMSGLNFDFESCVEKHHKHVCRKIKTERDVKRTVTVSYQCCHGFGRARNARLTDPCIKVDLDSVMETAEKMGGKDFIQTAKTAGLEDMLKKNVTVFLPTDKKFKDFSEHMVESNSVTMGRGRSRRAILDISGLTSKDLAMNHIVDGWVNIEDIENEQLLQTEYKNSTIRMNIFPRLPNDHNYDYPFRYTANCAPIMSVNAMATNGVVHLIDDVLQPVSGDIMEYLQSRNDMSILRTVLEKTKFDKILKEDRSFTLFAPSDAAFEKLPAEFRRKLKEGNGCALNIVKNHILDMTFCSMAVANDIKTNLYNILGHKLSFNRGTIKKISNNNNRNIDAEDDDDEDDDEDGDEEENDENISYEQTTKGVKDLTSTDNDVKINGVSKIIEYDIMATNGVIHIIDTVIPTDSAMPITSTLERNNLTIFRKLIEAANYDDYIDSMNNVTIFAPTNRAFDGSMWKNMLNKEPKNLKNNRELHKFLDYHIATPLIKTCDLVEAKINTHNNNEKLQVNLYTTNPIFTNIMNRATVNCARLIHFDDQTCGSVLHQVDRVLEPPKYNLLKTLESNEEYSMFLRFIREANLTSILTDPEQSLTLLVPKNDVFAEVSEWYNEMLYKKQGLKVITQMHILPETLCCAGIVHTDWPLIKSVSTLNGRMLRLNRDRRPKIENAGITKCDIVAKNGIIHEINDIISTSQRTGHVAHEQQFFNQFW